MQCQSILTLSKNKTNNVRKQQQFTTEANLAVFNGEQRGCSFHYDSTGDSHGSSVTVVFKKLR